MYRYLIKDGCTRPGIDTDHTEGEKDRFRELFGKFRPGKAI
jgi:hypothetical protein